MRIKKKKWLERVAQRSRTETRNLSSPPMLQAAISHLGDFEEIEMTMKVLDSLVRKRPYDISLSSSVTTHSYFQCNNHT
jgi:hypothetical protein